MPIKIQGELPVKEILEKENIFVMDETRAVHQDIRPIQILILNLMPLKEETELQLLRSLSNTPLQVDVTFMAVESHVAKNTSLSHLNKFYQTFSELKDLRFDGMIDQKEPLYLKPCPHQQEIHLSRTVCTSRRQMCLLSGSFLPQWLLPPVRSGSHLPPPLRYLHTWLPELFYPDAHPRNL